MSSKKAAPPTAALDDQIDNILGGILAEGWNDEVGQATQEVAVGPQYPPVPVREVAPPPRPPARPKRATKTQAADGATLFELPYPGQTEETERGMVVAAPPSPQDDAQDASGMFDIGLLTDLASGRRGAAEAALAAGITEGEIHSALAVALRDVDPKEIAKALGLQAAEQQLKSGAIYGAVLFDLVQDMAAGRLKAETKIELAKLLARVGKLEPKEDKSVGAGGGFVLNISMGGAPQPVTIEAG